MSPHRIAVKVRIDIDLTEWAEDFGIDSYPETLEDVTAYFQRNLEAAASEVCSRVGHGTVVVSRDV